ncbi:hypothetical protein AHMF7605_11340 [Adhaeribacter arboris]|uniref:Uncharacterized protein n=1 Tax=Adhaeribacter arboris TaxID=2072846 RepID=A0A2T2YEX8_9BACT|nr:hypothetical protein [Adhaeribacter arboris]PSR54071.1 hypothetical protein AHMF7605_11340 [Adhaeribacter arboris]
MELGDFNRATNPQRAALVWQRGTFLADRVSGGCTLCLYHMGPFFAEIWYRVVDNEIQGVRGFKSVTCLEPYWNLVDISDIT